MKPEKIIQLLEKYGKHKATLYPYDYIDLASEICQETEKEMRYAISLLKSLRLSFPLHSPIREQVNQFVQEHENK
jgi:hypothetical protein